MDKTKILAGGWVISCDPENRAGEYHIVIQGGKIHEIGLDLESIRGRYFGAEIVDLTGRLITPGLINAHVHSESILHRVRTDGRHFLRWYADTPFVAASSALLEPSNREDLRSLFVAAYIGHLKNGTTCVGEFAPAVDEKSFLEILQSIERTEVDCVVTLQNWDQLNQAKDLHLKKCRISLGKEQDLTIYSLNQLVSASRTMNIPLVAHLGELREDIENVRRNFNKSLVELLHTHAALTPQTLLLHANFCTSHDVDLIERHSIPVVVCARSAAMKRTGFPAYRHLVERRIPIALGTDWGSVDMMEEMKFVMQLPLLVPGIRPYRPLEVLRMATIEGARALGISDETGSIEPGKRADLVVFPLQDIRIPLLQRHNTANDLAQVMIHHLNTRSISDVMINGRFVLQRGKVVGIREDELLTAFQRIVQKYYPERLTAEEAGELKPNVIPFTSSSFDSSGDRSAFEEGLPESQGTGAVVDLQSREILVPPVPARKEREPDKKTELSKDVRKVFGEDDDF